MIVEEEVQHTALEKVIRCDKCLKAIRDTYDRSHMCVVVLNGYERTADGKGKVVTKGRYHLCSECAFSMQYEYDENRKNWKDKCCVTAEEQSALLTDLFPLHCAKGKEGKTSSLFHWSVK